MGTVIIDNKIISRPLSRFEIFYASRHEEGHYKNFQITARYSQRVDKLETLYKCLRKTIIDYHVLVCNVFEDKEKENLNYMPIQKCVLGDVMDIQICSDDLSSVRAKEQFMENMNDMTFSFGVNSPLFKVVVAGKNTLCTVFEHTIIDGIGGMEIHDVLAANFDYVCDPNKTDEFVMKYGSIDKEVTLNSVIFDYERDKSRLAHSIFSPIDELIPRSSASGSKSLSSVSNDIPRWKGSSFCSLNMKYAFRFSNVSKSDLSRLIGCCREKGVTLTAYAKVILAVSLNDIIDNGLGVSYRIALNLRRHLTTDSFPPPYAQTFRDTRIKILGPMALPSIEPLIVSGTPFSWSFVREVNTSLLDAANDISIMNQLNGFYNGEKEGFFNRALNGPKTDGVKISNLGRFPNRVFNESGKPWQVLDMIFAQDVAPASCEFMLNMISTSTGGLNLVLSYPQMAEESLCCSKLLQDFTQNLFTFAET